MKQIKQNPYDPGKNKSNIQAITSLGSLGVKRFPECRVSLQRSHHGLLPLFLERLDLRQFPCTKTTIRWDTSFHAFLNGNRNPTKATPLTNHPTSTSPKQNRNLAERMHTNTHTRHTHTQIITCISGGKLLAQLQTI